MIGLGSVELASKFLKAIISRIAELIDAVAHQNFTWDNASSDQAAVPFIPPLYFTIFLLSLLPCEYDSKI